MKTGGVGVSMAFSEVLGPGQTKNAGAREQRVGVSADGIPGGRGRDEDKNSAGIGAPAQKRLDDHRL